MKDFYIVIVAVSCFFAGYWYASCDEKPQSKVVDNTDNENVEYNYNGKRWDFSKIKPEVDNIQAGDIVTYQSGSGAKITVTASGEKSVYLHRRYANEIHGELLGKVHYNGKPYVDHQELRPGDYVCIGVKLGKFEFREWRSAR